MRRPAQASVRPPRKQTRRSFGFGPLERRLYGCLRAVADRPKDWAKDRLEIVWHVYERSVPVEKRQNFFVRLRQLQRAVNRKLQNAGDSWRIVSPADTFLALVDTSQPKRSFSPPAKTRPKRTSPRRRQMKPRRGLSVRACASLLRRSIEEGVNRSADLERLCIQQRDCSRRIYFQARAFLGLQAVHRTDGARWHWEVILPPPAISQD